MPHSFSLGSSESTSEYRRNINNALKQELRPSFRIDIPDSVKDIFRPVSPLEKLAKIAFDGCQQMERPRYKVGEGWTEWPQKPVQNAVMEFLKAIVPFLTRSVENEDGYVRHVGRQIYARHDDVFAGSVVSRKMNTDVLIDDGECRNDPLYWKDVLAVGVLKESQRENEQEKTVLELAQYAREIFRAQDRRFVLGYTLCGSVMRLWQFDRSGSSGSASFDINKDGLSFVQIMLGFYLMNNEQLGFDSTIQYFENGQRYINIFRAGRTERLVILEEVRKPALMVGRATTCWRVHREGDPSKYFIVKDSWQNEEERPEEGELIREATKKGVRNIARYYHHETVQINKKDVFGNVRRGSPQACGQTSFRNKTTTESPATASNFWDKTMTSQNRYQTETRKRGSSPAPISSDAKRPRLSLSTEWPKPSNLNRIHRCVVTCSPGTPIYKGSSCLAITNGLIGAISGHESLYKNARILHRDISIGNIMLNETEDDGFLIDFHLAIKVNRDEPSGGAQRKIGTKIFMAIGALLGKPHTFMHDLESFFWVLFWICAHCQGPKEPGKVMHRIVGPYEVWNRLDLESLATLKCGVMVLFGRTEKYITDFCKPLVPRLEKLQNETISNGLGDKIEDEQLYSRVKNILIEAREDIKARPVGKF